MDENLVPEWAIDISSGVQGELAEFWGSKM